MRTSVPRSLGSIRNANCEPHGAEEGSYGRACGEKRHLSPHAGTSGAPARGQQTSGIQRTSLAMRLTLHNAPDASADASAQLGGLHQPLPGSTCGAGWTRLSQTLATPQHLDLLWLLAVMLGRAAMRSEVARGLGLLGR